LGAPKGEGRFGNKKSRREIRQRGGTTKQKIRKAGVFGDYEAKLASSREKFKAVSTGQKTNPERRYKRKEKEKKKISVLEGKSL